MMIPDGIMLGFIQCPEGHQHDVAFHGSQLELATVAAILGLEPDPAIVQQIVENGHPDDGPLVLKPREGIGYVTVQPVHRASDFLQHQMQEQIRDQFGENPFD